MTRSNYAELSGGVGRSVHFRSERFRSRSILHQLQPNLAIAGGGASLYDLSMNGISFHLPAIGEVPEEGEVLSIRLSLAGKQAFSGDGRVVRTEPEADGRIKVAATLVDNFLDVPHLIRLHDDIAFDRELDRGLEVYACVPNAYRQVCSEVALFLQHWRALLDQRDQRSRENGAVSEDLEERAEARMREGWIRLRREANKSSLDCYVSREVLRAAKALTELQITPLVMPGPLWARAYNKPLGYPGDFFMMNYMYDGRRHGDSVYGRIMHQLGREERLADTVASRRDLMLEHIDRAVKEADGQGPVRISCLASGPAREVEDYLRRYDGKREILWTLIDQDDRALSYANERLLRAAKGAANRIKVNCLFTSFQQLIGNPELLGELADQDFLYSAGFFDYLPDEVARLVASRCMDMVRPGGRVLFGNAARAPDVHWVPEFVLDWRMNYRDAGELRSVLPAGAVDVQMLTDASSSWHFVEAHRGL